MDRDSLDKIHIRDLRLRCIVGINPEEREKAQDVDINITLYVDIRKAGRTDAIDDTVDYKSIKLKVAEDVEASSFFLVERLAQRIADICLADPRVARARVQVEKPGALRFARSVGVEIVRGRDGDV